jgi:hypothetical protein
MARTFPELTPPLTEFIAQQQMFFVATAPHQGRVNLSPKGMDTFRVLAPDRVGYLDLTGSGNETAAHLLENQRITFMFCAFAGPALILRLYAEARIVRPQDNEWEQLRPVFGPAILGERQLVVGRITSVQTSCGFGVPNYTFAGQRDQLVKWAENKGPDGLKVYRQAKNLLSIDGLPTGQPTE